MDAAAKREIMLPPLPGENNYPWEGGVNGTFYRIKRGVRVFVPENVARLIEQSEELREKSRFDTAEYTRGMGKRLG